MNTRGSKPTQYNEQLNQALAELHRSHERGEPHYVPTEHGWKNDRAFRLLTEAKEAKRVAIEGAYRITLLGLTTYRHIQTERRIP